MLAPFILPYFTRYVLFQASLPARHNFMHFCSTTSCNYNLENINFTVSVPWDAIFVQCTSKV